MKFSAEGAMRCPDGYSLAALQNAMRARELLCGRALMFDENKALRLNLGAASCPTKSAPGACGRAVCAM